MKKLLFIAMLFIAADTMAQRSTKKYNRWSNQQQSQNSNTNKKYHSQAGNFYAATALTTDYHYTSPNGQYFYTFQPDGNLVVYRSSDNRSLWSSGTQGRAVKAVFQKDGNLVLSDVNGGVVWDAFSLAKQTGKGVAENAESAAQHRTRGNRNAILMQDDGNLVIYAGNGTTPRWFTGTNQ